MVRGPAAVVGLRILQVQGLVHAADPDVFQAGHALGVDAHEDFDAVPGPRGYFGGGTPELSRQVTPE